MKKITVAIIGVGNRGGYAYGRLINKEKDLFDIVAICDLKQERLDFYEELFEVKKENLFLDEDEFFKERRADLLIIATPDDCHVRHTLKAFNVGYDIMVEKPVCETREDCEKLLAAQKKAGSKALVCHVLRYAPAFTKTKELLDAGTIGRLVAINGTEQVAYWHQAHSYVRGIWRNRKGAAPMILAKCCHDLDLFQYYTDSTCVSVSSVGDLTYFTKENAPEGAAERCVDCPLAEKCPYDAQKFYIDKWLVNKPAFMAFPYGALASPPLTEEKLRDAVQNGPYGRCVFHCDNDVVDHQITQMTFANGVKATLTMTGLTATGGRRYVFHGTEGEIRLDEEKDELFIRRFGEEPQIIDISVLAESGYGHGGGDQGLINDLYGMITGTSTPKTSLQISIESHLMGVCAEESRLKGGELVYLRK